MLPPNLPLDTFRLIPPPLILGESPGSLRTVPTAVNGPFQDTPWIGQVFGAIIGVALLIAVVAWIVFGLADLYSRSDIGPVKKVLWLIAFLFSAGMVWIVYGAVRFSRTGGTPGG